MDALEEAFKTQALLSAESAIAAQALFNALVPADRSARKRAKLRLKRALRLAKPEQEIVRTVSKAAFDRVKR